jgi:hypothetical protein
VKTEDAPTVKTEDVPKTKTDDAPPAGLRGVREAAPDERATTSSIDRVSVAPDKLVCVDPDALAEAFVAAVIRGADPAQMAKYGCKTIPEDAQVDILERLPSGFQFLRVVKVNVTSPSRPDSTVGYAFEIGR